MSKVPSTEIEIRPPTTINVENVCRQLKESLEPLLASKLLYGHLMNNEILGNNEQACRKIITFRM